MPEAVPNAVSGFLQDVGAAQPSRQRHAVLGQLGLLVLLVGLAVLRGEGEKERERERDGRPSLSGSTRSSGQFL